MEPTREHTVMEPMEEAVFDAGRLVRDYPPRWRDPNKQLVFRIASASGGPFSGRVHFRRWRSVVVPPVVEARHRFTVRTGVFEYDPLPDPAHTAWHLNFADPYLFCAYGTALLAQDELQVAEHPVLGSLREALAAGAGEPRTVDDDGEPTPVTIQGVQRRCAIETGPNPEIGCPRGLYGNAFSRATAAQVTAVTRPLVPPSVSNILAIAAPSGGDGPYTREQIEYVIRAACTGYRATLVASATRVVIHTGFWGCGAFGGNRSLMTILQALAAELAGVEVVFWAVDGRGAQIAEAARHRYEQLRGGTPVVSAIVDVLVREGYAWGVSDGN